MKKFFMIVCSVCLLNAVHAQDVAMNAVNSPKSEKSAVIQFTSESHDFGAIKTNAPVSHTFVFTNSGNSPLIINNVRTTCGCTVPEYPKETIMPGKTAEIVVTYDAASKGAFNKSATVYSNASNNQVILKIKGTVE